MRVESAEERDMVLNTVWIGEQRATELQRFVLYFYLRELS